MLNNPTNFVIEDESKRKEEWDEIENLVLDFQKQFYENPTSEEKEYALAAAKRLKESQAALKWNAISP